MRSSIHNMSLYRLVKVNWWVILPPETDVCMNLSIVYRKKKRLSKLINSSNYKIQNYFASFLQLKNLNLITLLYSFYNNHLSTKNT